MTSSNLPEVPQPKKQKFSWPAWFPYPSSWLKSLIIFLFFSLVLYLSKDTFIAVFKAANEISNSARSRSGMKLFFLQVFILSIIPIITFTHHFFHLLISRFLPNIQAREINKLKGVIPNVISIWEGLLGWLVIILSTLCTSLILTFLLPIFAISYDIVFDNYTDFDKIITSVFIVSWLTIGAYIYQVEFLFKQHLISVYSAREKLVKTQDNINQNTSNDVRSAILEMTGQKTRLQNPPNSPEINIQKTQLQSKFTTPLNIATSHQEIHIKINKKLLIYSLVPLVAFTIFLFSKIVNFQNPITQPIAANNQSLPSPTINTTPTFTTSPTLAPQVDNFREAVNKAINAANLTQSAKSKAEWNNVVNEWQTAINLMNAVPASSSNYGLAQQKIVEYQKNLDYARKNATSVK